MFIGHYAPAFIAAAASPKAPRLGTLFIAAQLIDIGFFLLVLTGVESFRPHAGNGTLNDLDLYHMPYTHSLVGTLIWAGAFTLILRVGKVGWRGAMIGGAVVLSHWFLDLIVHVPDLTFAGSPPKWGLGLWRYPALEIPLELGLLFGALVWWARAKDAWTLAPVPLLLFVGVLLVSQLSNWFAAPSPALLPVSALFAYGLFVAMASWVDHKTSQAKRFYATSP